MDLCVDINIFICVPKFIVCSMLRISKILCGVVLVFLLLVLPI